MLANGDNRWEEIERTNLYFIQLNAKAVLIHRILSTNKNIYILYFGVINPTK